MYGELFVKGWYLEDDYKTEGTMPHTYIHLSRPWIVARPLAGFDAHQHNDDTVSSCMRMLVDAEDFDIFIG